MYVKHRLAALLFVASFTAALSIPASAFSPLPITGRYAHTATLLPDGSTLIVGGQSDDTPSIVGTVQMALGGSNELVAVSNAAPYVARSSHTATLLPSGEVLITGGVTGVGTVADNVQIYSPKYDCWRPTVAFTKTGGHGRFNHTATLLRTGQVLICGGQGDAGTPGVPYAASATCDLFTPTIPAPAGCASAGGTMDATGVTLQAPRALHTATLLNDGRVYLAGGLDNTGTATNPYLSTAEIYAPGSNSTLAASGVIVSRAYHRSTLLGNGKVLIVGGYNNTNAGGNLGYLDSSEIYDPVADKTTPGATLPTRVMEQAQTIQVDGTVVVVGGLTSIPTTYFNPGATINSNPPGPDSFLTGTYSGAPWTMNITGVDFTAPLNIPNLSVGVSGTVTDGFVLFQNPTITFTGGSASLTPGAVNGAGAVTGSSFTLVGAQVGCSGGTCGKILSTSMHVTLSNAHGTYSATPVAISNSNLTMVNTGPSGSVNVSTVDWSPHGLQTGGITSGSLTSGTILQGDVTITGLPAAFIGADLAGAQLAVNGGAFSTATYNCTLTGGTGYFNAGFGGSPQVTLDGGTGLGRFSARISIVNVSGTVTAITPIAQDPCNAPSTGACPAGQGGSLQGVALTGLAGTLSFAPTRVDLVGASFASSAGDPAVIRQMSLGDEQTYTPVTNTWTFTDHHASGFGIFGQTGTLLPSGTFREFGGRECYKPTCGQVPYGDSGGFITKFAGLIAGAKTMLSARSDATATLLPSGGILIAGGTNGPDVLPTAELFDPRSQSFSATGPMNVARDLHTATLLPNGRVLVAGGFATTATSSGSTNTAELFFPNTNNWVATSTLPVNVDNHAATLMPDGNVLVTGGFSNGSYLSSAEIYITTMAVWRSLPSMPVARAVHSATLLQDGRVLLAGGINATGVLCSAVIYDPNYRGAGAPWYADTNIGGAPCTPVQGQSATLLKNGDVLFAGGDNAFGEVNKTYLYRPAAVPTPDNAAAPGTWSKAAAGTINSARFGHSAVLLPDGDVLIMGGAQSAGNALSSIESYEAEASSWQVTGGMVNQRLDAAAVVGLDGNVYMFGGSNGVTVENTYESAYFGGSVDGESLGVPLGTRKPVLTAISTMPFSGGAYSSVPATNGSAVTITGKNLLGFGEASGGAAGSGSSSHHNPRLLLQSMSDSGGSGSQQGSGFFLDMSTAIYAAGNLWPAVDTGILVNAPNVVGSNAAPPGPGGTILPYGWYQLRAYANAIYSDALPVQVGPPLPPLAPTSVQVADIGRSSITWTWTKPAGMASNQLDGWEVFQATTSVFLSSAAGTTFTQFNLAPNTTAQIVVAAYTTSGDGPLGYSTTYYTYCSTPAFNAVSVSTAFLSVGFNSITLTWDPDGNMPGTVYEVYQSTDFFNLNVTTPVPSILNTVSTSAVINFLQPNQTYFFKIRAFNGNGLPSDYSIVVATRTRAPASAVAGVPAGAPYDPTTAIEWTWIDPGGVLHYNVYNTTVAVGQPGHLISTTTTPNFFDTNLATNSIRSIMVSAVTSAGEGPLSDAATAFTLAAVPGPVTPGIVNLSTGSFTAFWTANGNPLLTTYQMVVLDPFGVARATVDTSNFNAGFGNFPPQSGASQFSVEVDALNGAGAPSSFLVLGTTFTLPDNPSNLTITGTTPNSISLAWATNNNSSSATYEVQYTTAVDFTNLGAIRKAVAFSAKFNGNSLTVSSLLTSTTYQFRVQASNPFGQLSAFTASLTTSPFNGGVPLGSIAGPINHLQSTTLTGTIGNGRAMTLVVPAGAFAEDTFVTISTFDASGGGNKCSGGVNVGVSITPNPYIQPIHPVFLTLGYTAGELGAVPTAEAALNRVDPSGTCVPLATTFDSANNTFTAQLNHFSQFQLADVAPSNDPSDTVVFPNPFMPSAGNGYVTFKNMPAGARVRIFTLRGQLVYDQDANGSGIATWGGTNRFGRPAASGVYLAVIESGSKKQILKVVVLR